jgi:diguanylate cyclase (GGDEF)-like protein
LSDFEDSGVLPPEAADPPAGRLSRDDLARRQDADELYLEARSIRQLDRPRLKMLAEQSLELSCVVGADGEQYRRGMAAALSLLAYYSATAGDADVAVSQGSQALALLDTDEPSTILSDLYDTMGWARYSQGNFVEAVEVLLQAQRVAEQLGDRTAVAIALDTMASVHEVTGHFDDALEEHLQSIAIHQEIGDPVSAAFAQNNLAYTYLALGDNASALREAQTALDYVSAHGHRHIEVSVLDTMAAVYISMGDLDTALEYSQRGLELAREHGSLQDVADNLMTVGRIALEQKRYDQALTAIQGALDLMSRGGRAIEAYTCHELLSRIYEQQGDMASALREYRLYHELAQSRIDEEAQIRLAHLRVEHQLDGARKDAEIHRLRSLALEREVEQRRIAQARLEAQASLDPLTGLYNRRHLTVLDEELHAAVARQEAACLVLIDIDRFKEVNDSYGHVAGDRVLVSLAEALRANSRATDVPLRYGGDEFLVLIIGMDGPTGFETAERLRGIIERSTVNSDGVAIGLTISAGVACVPRDGGADLADLIARADRALYTAKHMGRNRVVTA